MTVEFNNKKYSVKKKSGLQTLDLTAKGIKDIRDIIGLENLTNVQVLKLAKNQISEIDGLENLICLERLYLNDNIIQEIKGIKHLDNLKLINLNNNYITTSENLDEMDNLMVLSIYGNPLFKYAEEQFGLILSPNKAVKYCGKLSMERIKDTIKKMSLIHKKIRLKVIASKTGMNLTFVKKIVEEMIINQEIDARINDDFLSFGQDNAKYAPEGTLVNLFPIKISCTNCNETIEVVKEMSNKDYVICKTCGSEIFIQKGLE